MAKKQKGPRSPSIVPSAPADCRRWLASVPTLSVKEVPDQWTVEWERFLQIPKPHGLAQFYLNARFKPQTDELLISCYRGTYRDVCRMQHELSITACNLAAHADFDKAWLGWTATEKKDFLRLAIIRGVGVSAEHYEAIRPYCREASIAFLETSLLDVLKYCLLDDIAEIPKTPIIYPVEFMKEIDETVLSPELGLMLRYTRLQQTQLICERSRDWPFPS